MTDVQREDLVSDHIGGTAKKTSAIIGKAMDGVLFIHIQKICEGAYRNTNIGID